MVMMTMMTTHSWLLLWEHTQSQRHCISKGCIIVHALTGIYQIFNQLLKTYKGEWESQGCRIILFPHGNWIFVKRLRSIMHILSLFVLSPQKILFSLAWFCDNGWCIKMTKTLFNNSDYHDSFQWCMHNQTDTS